MAKQNPTQTARQSSAKAPVTKTVAPRPRATSPGQRQGVPSRIASLQRGFRETMAELRKVQWPDRMTTRNLTLVVIGMSATLAALLGIFDAILTRLFEWLIRL